MTLDYTALRFWFDVLQLAGYVALGIYVWLSSRNRVTNARIGELEVDVDARLDRHGDRLTRLEVHAGAAPTHDDLKRLHQRLDIMNGELQGMRGEFAAAGRTLNLIHEYLLNHGSSK